MDCRQVPGRYRSRQGPAVKGEESQKSNNRRVIVSDLPAVCDVPIVHDLPV